jgi:hypothetical protein
MLRAGDPLRRRQWGRAATAARRWVAARGTLTLTLIVGLIAAAVVFTINNPFAQSHAAVTTPTSSSIEARWGVRFTQIGISADGGMVDVRYLVLDADKATALAADVQGTPLLVEESSQRVIYAVAMKAHAHDIQNGGRFYLLYRNTGGLLKPGKKVTITLAGDRLQHVTVLGTKGH